MKEKEKISGIRGELVIKPEKFKKKTERVKALIFDWDGIFNDGKKGQIPSTFNEIDSMGVNMLRFGYYLIHHSNPYTAIVTGEKNETAIKWAEREHFHDVFFRVKNKGDVLDAIIRNNSLEPEEIMFVFDDIHDLSLANQVGLRILVKNPGASLFAEYCKKMSYCDYITCNTGGNMAIREISELLLKTINRFEDTIKYRMDFHGRYYEYLETRNLVQYDKHEFNF